MKNKKRSFRKATFSGRDKHWFYDYVLPILLSIITALIISNLFGH